MANNYDDLRASASGSVAVSDFDTPPLRVDRDGRVVLSQKDKDQLDRIEAKLDQLLASDGAELADTRRPEPMAYELRDAIGAKVIRIVAHQEQYMLIFDNDLAIGAAESEIIVRKANAQELS